MKNIRYLDASRFRQAIINGAARIIKNLEHLNSINVFPVPDGDTGINLALSFKGALRRISRFKDENLGRFLKNFAESFVIEAKGNSGVIFSQFLIGFANALENKKRAEAKDVAEALRVAAQKTYTALEKPREGTILTVIKETAEEADETAKRENNLLTIFENALKRAKRALEKTPELLPELKKKGVVDSGGLGFVLFLEGIVDALRGKKEELPEVEISEKESEFIEEGEIKERYCTEAVLEANDIDGKTLKMLLAALGGSLIIVGAGRLFHIHIHTNWPQKVFKILKEKGKILKKKVDDMVAQNLKVSKKTVGIAVDSTADMPPDVAMENGIQVVPQKIIVDGKVYLDSINMTRDEFIGILKKKGVKLATSQPAPVDFESAYKKLLESHKSILVITVASHLSGTIRSAEVAAKNFDVPIKVFDSRRISFAETLLALRAVDKVREGWDIERIYDYLEKLVPYSYFLFTLDTFKYIVRSGRIRWTTGKFAQLLNIKPIMTLSNEGVIEKKGLALGKKRVLKKIKEYLLNELDRSREYDFAIAYVDTPEIVFELKPFIMENFKVKRFFEGQITPVIALHVGPGAYGVFALPYL